MSFERPTGSAGPEPMPVSGSTDDETARPRTGPPGVPLQILATEHWSLLATRALAWNESFSRTGMFLSTLSGAIVALALVAQPAQFGAEFRLFALAILPVVLFIGIGTFLRMGNANYHDALCVVGMNRIRHAYVELAPDAERYFVMGAHDDDASLSLTMGVEPGTSMGAQILSSAPMLVVVVNAVLVAAIASMLAIQLGVPAGVSLWVGVFGFVIGLAGQFAYASRGIARAMASYRPMFPRTPSA